MEFFIDRRRASLDAISSLGKRDILVGIPSLRNQKTIGFVIHVISRGLRHFYPDKSSVIMISDGASPDDTVKVARRAETATGVDSIVSIYAGPPGKGSAYRNIFEAARILQVKACVVVNGDLRNISSQWIKPLLDPILSDQADYVSPGYLLHKYDGTINNILIYPLLRSLFSLDLRHPIGGDFSFNATLLDQFLASDVWENPRIAYGIDITLTLKAILRQARFAEANLAAKIHDAKDPAIFKENLFRNVTGSFFAIASRNIDRWHGINRTHLLPAFGDAPIPVEPDPIAVSYDGIVLKFNETAKTARGLWERYLSPENREIISYWIDGIKGRSLDIADDKWARIVYDILVSFARFRGEEEEVLTSLIPLYFIKIADVINKTANLNSLQAEGATLALAEAFEREKPYLLTRWEKEIGTKYDVAKAS